MKFGVNFHVIMPKVETSSALKKNIVLEFGEEFCSTDK